MGGRATLPRSQAKIILRTIIAWMDSMLSTDTTRRN
jgi:hypothetical protein